MDSILNEYGVLGSLLIDISYGLVDPRVRVDK